MGKIIAICNQKGGVGKTTTCVNLAAGLGVLEKKVLVIDTDPQANATISFGLQAQKLNNPALAFMSAKSVMQNRLVSTKSPNVDIVPFIEDVDFFKDNSQNSSFKQAIRTLAALYDYIIIDSVPFFKAKNLEILKSSDAIIIPIQCDYYAIEGLHRFLRTVRYVQKNLNPTLDIEGFLLTMFDKRVNLSKKVVLYMQSYFKTLVLKTIINRNTKVSQAPGFGKTIFAHDVSSVGAKDYLALAHEIIENNIRLKTPSDIPSIPEEEESFFNKKTFGKESTQEHQDDYLSKLLENKVVEEKSFPENLRSLLGLHKNEVKERIGLHDNNINRNVWFYQYNKSKSIFKKKYLYLYFKNDFVKKMETKRFKNI